MPSIRMDRINSQIGKEVSRIILQEVNDPRISGMVSVKDVKTSSDLSQAKIFLSIYGGDKKETFNAIMSAGGFIRRALTKAIQLRITPELVFILDEGFDKEQRIQEILKDIHDKSAENKGDK